MKILVVDDEQDVKTLFEQRFRKEIKSGQAEFIFAFSGEDALVQLNKWEHEAMLILSDINMPGMSGLQLLENVKRHQHARHEWFAVIRKCKEKIHEATSGSDDDHRLWRCRES